MSYHCRICGLGFSTYRGLAIHGRTFDHRFIKNRMWAGTKEGGK